MARYIDADALKNDILMKYKKNWEVPCLHEDRIIQRVITDLRVLIERSVTADVVPKSEIDLYRKQVDELEDELASTYDKLENAKSEVAREIFEEIDKILDFATEHTPLRMPFQWIDMRFMPYYNELKKKYTEGET